MKKLYLMCLVLVILFWAGCKTPGENVMQTQSVTPGDQHDQIFEKTITKTISSQYLLYLPPEYGKTEKQWPMMLFLHGAGERGDDLEKVKVHGPPKIVETQKDFPFILVSPQCPEGKWWPDETEVLINLLDDIVSRYDVDTNRVYLTGLSMGGFGAWKLAIEYPERFAAVVPICGGGQPYLVDRIKDVPVWAFHGAKDGTVDVRKTKEMVEALKACGGNVKLTIYPEAEHDSWTQTYDNKELYKWLLKQSKK